MDCGSTAFALQVLPNLARVLPHDELARLRLISHSWNAAIVNTAEFPRKQVTFSKKQWGPQVAGSLQYDNLVTTWQSAQIKNASLITIPAFIDFWKVSCRNIRHLKLNNLQISCSTLAQFLQHHCRFLKSVDLDMIHYHTSKPMQIERANGEAGVAIIVCDHKHGQNQEAPCTIDKIRIGSNFVVPTCVLAVLTTRSAGRLESFTYQDAKMTKHARFQYYPSDETVYANLVNLVRASQDTLYELVWTNNTNGYAFFNALRALVRQIRVLTQPALQLKRLTFRERKLNNFVGILHSRQAVFDFIKSQGPYLEYLSINQGNPNIFMDRLPDLFPDLHALKSLHLTILSSAVPQGFNLDALGSQLPNLECLAVSLQPVNANAHQAISPSYLRNVPNRKLKSLVISQNGLMNQDFVTVIRRLITLTPQMITCFTLHHATDFKSESMQLVIRNMPQLRTLAINLASSVKDTGITGLDNESVLELKESGSYQLMQAAGMQAMEHPVADMYICGLQKLQCLEQLSLHGCAQLTDVSVCTSFYFPKLRYLDLSGGKISDTGLVHIGKFCPNLQTFVFSGISTVTSFHGLNALLRVGTKITKVYVQQKTANRLLDPRAFSRYYIHPDYKKIVKLAGPAENFTISLNL